MSLRARGKPAAARKMALSPELVALCARIESDPGPDPSKRPLTDDDYEAAASELAAKAPPGPLWIFAYGSLIWKNTFGSTETRRATAFGWHRSFCMTRKRWRGSPAQPGLMMALRRGGRCDGVAYRMIEEDRAQQIENLLRREIEYHDAVPFMRWIYVTDGIERWPALASWIGPVGAEVSCGKPLEEVSKILARACGHVGSGAEYLFNTVLHLEQHGIRDRNLWRLQHLVAQEIRSFQRSSDEDQTARARSVCSDAHGQQS